MFPQVLTLHDLGMEVVKEIEKAKTDKYDKPLEDIKIINIDVFFD